ncbi:serine/threonine-protein kinase 11-interacting protein isoform X2 [Thrips palmi]|uniref:Serine/threonine-protein kinase 11-interacting protein isoform X2 n=1 Tax=Thrips palmi TaxID=161013 RepID=A0A6P8ZWP4_THRPL|nr:serine/threonine-protein kinase 11-interacting protein isoform X2 [Thrips palmi]
MVLQTMAPETTNWQDLRSLATLLRDNGDRVLSGNSKLRLTSALLSKLNAAFSSISLLGSNGDFQVTSAHASQPPTTAQLHFLHDFVQKTVGLTLTGNGICKRDLVNAHPTIDLSRFKSLRHLELRSCILSHGSVPNQTLEGLSTLRSQLEALVLVQVYHSEDLLWEVLAGGAVSSGPDVHWIKMSQLVISYCRLRSFGNGLPLACNLQWLDVSHNEIADAEAVSSSLAALPKLCYLNLSYNRLTKVPVPSYGPPCPIQILLLSHNYVENLNGIERWTGLRELNLEVNQLQDHSSLQPLRTLYQLQHIRLGGNPISYHKRHRLRAASYMPPRAVFPKHNYRRDAVKISPFMIDGQKLSEAELQAVRDGPLPTNLSSNSSRSEHVSIDLSTESNKILESSVVSGSEIERSTRKSRKVREVKIEDFDFDTLDELPDKSFTSNQMTGSIESSGEHLQTKKQLETVKAHFKEDWLRAQGGFAVQELMGLQPSSAVPVGSVASISSSTRPLFNSTPLGSPKPSALYPGHLDELGIFESIILRKSPDTRDNSGAGQTTPSMQYHTANDSDTVLYVSTGNEETLLPENGQNGLAEAGYDADLDEKHEQEDDDVAKLQDSEDFDAGEHSTYLVTRINMPHRDLFLVTTPRYIKEIDANSGSVIQHWRLNSLESCVLLSAVPCQVQLTFNTAVPSKKTRVYEMDSDEAQKGLLPSLKAILETRSLSALNVAAFRCMKCSGEFSVELNSRKATKVCPTCGSTLVFELDEAPLPTLGSSQGGPKSQIESAVVTPSAPVPQPSSELLHSPSDSSIENVGVNSRASRLQVFAEVHPSPSIAPRSAVSLESPGSVIQPLTDYPATVNQSLRRCESDIDIISNPSQSSIEILDDVSRTSGTPGRKRSSEERQVVAIPSLVTVPEVSSTLSPLPAGLTESSSSGSITDSVCTAYENNTGTGGMGLRRGGQGLAKSVLKEEFSRENSPRYKEEPEQQEPSPQPTSLSNVLDNLLQTMSSKISASESLERKTRKKNAVPDSIIQYNYVDFSAVDHRLKLHLHLSILDADEREVLQLLLRGEVVTGVPENRYPGILLISSQKVYIMKITGPEEGDAVDRWISRVVAVPLEKLLSITALPWGLGISLTLQGASTNNLVMVLRDQQYTHSFFTFLKGLSKEPHWKIENVAPEKHSLCATGALQDMIKNILPEADLSIKLAALLCSCHISKDEEDENYPGSLLLVTTTSLLLTSDNLHWLMPPEYASANEVAAECIGKQSISNLIQVESDGAAMWLQFLDEAAGGEETWKLNLQSEDVLEQIVAAIRSPWEELFSVPLHVVQVNKT